jgi:cytidine deaminase
MQRVVKHDLAFPVKVSGVSQAAAATLSPRLGAMFGAHRPEARDQVVAGNLNEPGSSAATVVCRQVMAELCDEDMPVLLGNLRGDSRQTTVAALLPGSFKFPATT